MTGTLLHLVGRFFGTLRSAQLRPAEQAAVSGLLRPEEWDLFWGQGRADQRHGVQCAQVLAARRPARPDLARAALLHDVGKRHGGLGVVGRALATTLDFLHLPLPRRHRAYREHGPLGADELQAAGAETIVVAFARWHHAGRPEEVEPSDWAELCRADRL